MVLGQSHLKCSRRWALKNHYLLDKMAKVSTLIERKTCWESSVRTTDSGHAWNCWIWMCLRDAMPFDNDSTLLDRNGSSLTSVFCRYQIPSDPFLLSTWHCIVVWPSMLCNNICDDEMCREIQTNLDSAFCLYSFQLLLLFFFCIYLSSLIYHFNV